MAILKIKDANGNVQEILAIKGENGKDGKDGKDYVLTDADKQEIANQIATTALPPVTTADNGKFLKVINGAWGAATITNAEEVTY